jgi:hypothetical protein
VKRTRSDLVGSSGNASHIIVFGMCLDRIWAMMLGVLTDGVGLPSIRAIEGIS